MDLLPTGARIHPTVRILPEHDEKCRTDLKYDRLRGWVDLLMIGRRAWPLRLR